MKNKTKHTQAERTRDVAVYDDCLLRVTVVVRHRAEWWLVPRSRDGWKRRQRLNITPQVELERLTLAWHVTADWLGIPNVTP